MVPRQPSRAVPAFSGSRVHSSQDVGQRARQPRETTCRSDILRTSNLHNSLPTLAKFRFRLVSSPASTEWITNVTNEDAWTRKRGVKSAKIIERPGIPETSTKTKHPPPQGHIGVHDHSVAMQFSPLQSRLVASLAATLCLVVVYYLLTSPIGAFAADVDVRTEPWLDLGSMGIGFSDATEKSYEPFFGSLMGNLENRAVGDTIPLQNNKPLGLNIPPQKLICYTVKASDISKGSSKRDDVGAGAAQDTGGSASNSTIYISANTCQRPTPGDNSGKGGAVPQMALFVSNTKSATGCPDESVLDGGKTPDGFEQITFEEGAATFAANATDDIYVGVWAPKVPSGMQGQYSYEVAASIDGFFHQYLPSLGRAELLWLDSDSTSALLVSRNLTDDESQIKKVMSEDPPYDLYVGVQGSQDLDGLWNSACGLQLNAIIGANKEGTAKNNTLVKNVVTLRGPGDFPKQQLYVVGLNGTTNYAGVLVRPSNVTLNSKRDIDGSGAAGQGSVVFQATNFSTNSGKCTRRQLPIGHGVWR